MMVFFISADERVYARYGGRDSKNADNRQSLEGLRYTMASVLQMHRQQAPDFAPRHESRPQFIRDIAGERRGCFHCHQVKETLNQKLVEAGNWTRDKVWRYPLPENLGFRLEVDRGNVVESVTAESAAARGGLKKGDLIRRIANVPIHAFGDAQFALDHAQPVGRLDIAWTTNGTEHAGTLDLAKGWKRTDIAWRTSLRRLIPDLPLYGPDLNAGERAKLGLAKGKLGFRQNERLHSRAKAAGVQVGDIILGVDGRELEMNVDDFLRFIQSEYLVGDEIVLVVLRNGQRLKIPLVLATR
jgi:serine protease Do